MLEQNPEDNSQGMPDDNFMPSYTPGNIPQAFHDNSNTVRLLLKSPLLRDIYHDLLGEERTEDAEGRIKFEKITDPLMSKIAAGNLLIILRSFVNENVVSGIYTEEEIRMKVVWASKHIVKWIAQTNKKYEIKNYNWRGIVLIVEQNVDAALKKAKNGATLETIGNMNQQREIQTFQQQVPVEQTKSVWDRIPLLKGFGGRQ